jgi:hypothetical protein
MISYVLFGGVLLLLTVAVLLAAVRSGARGAAGDSVQARKDSAIEALRVLEFEYQTGKVSEDEYRPLRRRLELEAVQARDAMRSDPDPDAATDEPTEAECGGCGRRLTGEESFCPACGTALR